MVPHQSISSRDVLSDPDQTTGRGAYRSPTVPQKKEKKRKISRNRDTGSRILSENAFCVRNNIKTQDDVDYLTGTWGEPREKKIPMAVFFFPSDLVISWSAVTAWSPSKVCCTRIHDPLVRLRRNRSSECPKLRNVPRTVMGVNLWFGSDML